MSVALTIILTLDSTQDHLNKNEPPLLVEDMSCDVENMRHVRVWRLKSVQFHFIFLFYFPKNIVT